MSVNLDHTRYFFPEQDFLFLCFESPSKANKLKKNPLQSYITVIYDSPKPMVPI